MVVSDFKELIADYIARQADWRAEKADEYPEDVRNARCADGLEELASYMRGLPDDDERLVELGTLGVREGLFSPPSGDTSEYAISRFRFHDPTEDCGAFLTHWVRDVKEDSIRQAQLAGELPYDTEDDH